MKIKKFKARSFSEALDMVKKELSEDAVILSTEEKRGIKPFVEITAAVDYDGVQPQERPAVKNQMNDLTKKADTSFFGTGQSHGVATAESAPHFDFDLNEIKHEIGSLRKTFEEMKENGYRFSLSPGKREIFNFLSDRAVRTEFALRLCEKARDLSHLTSVISGDIKVSRDDGRKKAVMLIGPTGVGKTTTIAKLTARAISEGRKAAIINLDTYRIGAVEQVRIYARLLGIPLAVAGNVGELRNSIVKFMDHRDLIFIDTTGRNPRDETYINEILSVCGADIPLDLHLLMSASCDDEFMVDAYRYYRRLPIDCIGFTKMDEAVRYGSLYNLLLTYRKPVAFITTGQKVPGDLEFVSPESLAGLILKKRCYAC